MLLVEIGVAIMITVAMCARENVHRMRHRNLMTVLLWKNDKLGIGLFVKRE